MPGSFLDAFSAVARQSWPTIRRGVREGLSARAIGRAIRGAGLSISNDALFTIARKERESWLHVQALRFTPPGRAFNPAALPMALSRLSRDFAVSYQVSGTIAGTNVPTSVFITLSLDELRARENLEEMAEEIASQKVGRYGVDVVRVELVDALRAGPLGTL